eukprot:CAMPEP_0175986054 /NCGR_PEP_ID=MMETSP0108-20121206/49930_1 /TAXON_ID=195067 ORGANISM="Goniomonas pacifica, Strain CCMP1869" /NCGR_SAMPLE_ID=MMETSP0108 /ASSEMBLY_ACC=CAM_ASM_000204 /LENGTH=118 /DNA_ID=CAMNT_0017317157 /DNA_START=110 /DNA_END=462 /DNA_ORIENTATION=-
MRQTVVPFNTQTKQFTLLREFAQGSNAMLHGVACGRVDQTHESRQHAAACELSEELMLRGGRWISLLPPDHPGVLECKWAEMRFTPFLVLDPETDPQPRPRDAEELIEVLSDVTVEHL